MKLFRGTIARLVVSAFASISLLAVAIAVISVISAQKNLALMAEARQRSEMALLSARIRSECLVLTDLVEGYVFQVPGHTATREEIVRQSDRLDELINEAISKVNPGDVDESLELGNIRQGLIAFSTQTERVLNAYDASQGMDDRTERELRFLIESYQTPLVDALQRFENYETNKSAAALDEANRLAGSVSNLMMITALSVVVVSFLLIRTTTLRFVLPLITLREGVEYLRTKNLNWRINVTSDDEMGELSGAINKMANDLRKSQEQLKEYTTNLEEQVRSRTTELRKLTVAVEQSPSSVVITNTQGIIEYVNPRFTTLTGYTAEEVIGKKSDILQSGLTPRDTYTDLWKAITAGNIWKGEFINRKKDGELYWEEAIISPVRNDDGETTHYIAIKEDISHRKKAETELRRMATIDPLTEAFNRRQFFLMCEFALAESIRYKTPLTAMMFDVDHFKRVNDTYGHPVGDEVLRQLVTIVRDNIREVDILGRYGGEEFALLMPHTTPMQAMPVAERIREQVENHVFETEHVQFGISISIGVVAWHPEEKSNLEQLIQKADLALYRAKQTGRNRVILYDPSLTHPNLPSEGHSHD